MRSCCWSAAFKKSHSFVCAGDKGIIHFHAGAPKVAHRLVNRIGSPDRCQPAEPVLKRQLVTVAPVGLDPVARLAGDQARGRHRAAMALLGGGHTDCRFVNIKPNIQYPAHDLSNPDSPPNRRAIQIMQDKRPEHTLWTFPQ